MFLQPKNKKYRKEHKRSHKQKKLQKGHRLKFGSYALKSINTGFIKASQIEAVRRVIIRKIRKIGIIWIRCFPQKPITNKAAKTRMGKGKGTVQYWVCPVRPGQILFEISGSISPNVAKNILKLASQKLPVLTKFVDYNTASLNPLILGPSKNVDFKDRIEKKDE